MKFILRKFFWCMGFVIEFLICFALALIGIVAIITAVILFTPAACLVFLIEEVGQYKLFKDI